VEEEEMEKRANQGRWGTRLLVLRRCVNDNLYFMSFNVHQI